MGKFGLRPWELDNYSLSAFISALEGYAEKQEEEWQRVRMLSYHMVIPHQKKGSRLKPKDLFSLPSDSVGKVTNHVSKVYKLSPEEIKQWHSGTWKPKEEING